jgi:chaperonin GroEL
LRAVNAVEQLELPGDEAMGASIVVRALEEPLRQISLNAGSEAGVVVQRVREGQDTFGYNAEADEYEDLVKAGVIDPTKVVRTALQNGASIAGLLLTTEALVTEIPEKEAAAGPPGGMPPHSHDF